MTNDQQSNPHQQARYGIAMLMAMGFRSDRPGHALHVYGGTVDQVTVARRRAKNKAARKSRRVNRKRGA